MSTDFFQQQDAARRRTGMLVVLFCLAVAAIVLAIYLLVLVLFAAGWQRPVHWPPPASGRRVAPPPGPGSGPVYPAVRSGLAALWEPQLFLWVCLGTVTVIALGSLYKIAELAKGGEVVALMLGGRRVDPRTTDLGQRRLLNVVEEMALASGLPVPPVYVLDNEPGINAFAAGHAPANAVIGVSRGALTYLSRDELQGVMAHEFSHILNGDMRLNLRLIGVLNGILILAILGYYLMRAAGSSSRRSRDGRGRALVFLLGLGLLVIGYIGVLFGKLIKAAVSRQREYLADASAVQFTRYPGGIAGALKKIGGLAQGSRIQDAHAEECSHLFFGDAFAGSLFNLFATHPPLVERIRRIEPDFDGRFPRVEPLVEEPAPAEQPERLRRRGAGLPPRGRPVGPRRRALPLDPTGVGNRIGVPAVEQILVAAAILESMPRSILDAAHEPYSARAVVYALLLNRDEAMRRQQLAMLQERIEELSYRETVRLAAQTDPLADQARLPLIDIAQAALKGLSGDQYAAFRENVEALVAADGKMDLFEYVVRTVLLRNLDVHFGRAREPAVRYHAISPLVPSLGTVLSTMAYAGHDSLEGARRAFDQAASAIDKPLALLPRQQCSLQAFDRALAELAQAAPQVKRRILTAAAACVGADGKVTAREGELFRVVAAVLGCPMPPLAAPAGSVDPSES
ncbi:MAG: M48 family metallopeptidase [Thermoguttaceae bacterium]